MAYRLDDCLKNSALESFYLKNFAVSPLRRVTRRNLRYMFCLSVTPDIFGKFPLEL